MFVNMIVICQLTTSMLIIGKRKILQSIILLHYCMNIRECLYEMMHLCLVFMICWTVDIV